MQTLRKKTSPLKYKNETSRFLGDGLSFKAKLIGILEVSEARGDGMCQEALSDLKMAIRAAGEHKQRITINIAIDGLRLRDEKTGDSLYHHPVHKISFIAQDMSDSRAFGYIFGSPDTGHRFFGIKTDKAASQVVIAMRDLFQVVFALKKKEIELAKQHLDKSRYGSSSMFSENSLSSSKFLKTSTADSSKSSHGETKASASGDTHSSPAVADLVDLELELNSLQQGLTQMERITPSDPFGSKDDPFGDSFISYPPKNPLLPPPPSSDRRDRASRTSESSSGGVFSPKTTPHIPTAVTLPSTITTTGSIDSVNICTPPVTSNSAVVDFNFTTNAAVTTSSITSSSNSAIPTSTAIGGGDVKGSSHDDDPGSSGGWFTPPPMPLEVGGRLTPTPGGMMTSVSNGTSTNDVTTSVMDRHELAKQEIMSQFDVFTELDPLEKKSQIDYNGSESQCTGKSKPYVDKKHFFRELKNPPKKVLNDLVQSTSNNNTTDNNLLFTATFGQQSDDDVTATTTTAAASLTSGGFTVDPFGEDPFDQTDPFAEAEFTSSAGKQEDPFGPEFAEFKFPLSSGGLMIGADVTSRDSPSDKMSSMFDKDSKLNSFRKLHEHCSLELSSESECAPEPPPRPPSTTSSNAPSTYIKPPPLPPKKHTGHEIITKQPPPVSSSLIGRYNNNNTEPECHYDYIDTYQTGSSLFQDRKSTLDETYSTVGAPPLPAPARRGAQEKIGLQKGNISIEIGKNRVEVEEDYLAPIAMPVNTRKSGRIARNSGPVLLPPPQNPKKGGQVIETVATTIASILESKTENTVTTTFAHRATPPSLDSLDITLSQLTLSGLNELAEKLKIPASQLSNMTLVQLTSYLSNFIKNGTDKSPEVSQDTTTTPASFQADFAANFNTTTENPSGDDNKYDRYAVFRELLQDEMKQTRIDTEPQEIIDEKQFLGDSNNFEDTFEPENNFSTVSNQFEASFPLENCFSNINANIIEVGSTENTSEIVDKYAALRDIVNIEIEQFKPEETNDNLPEQQKSTENLQDSKVFNSNLTSSGDLASGVSNLALTSGFISPVLMAGGDNITGLKSTKSSDSVEVVLDSDLVTGLNIRGNGDSTGDRSPKSPLEGVASGGLQAKMVKSPVPIAVTDLVQGSTRLTSGSLSDVVSGSSPEVDHTGSTPEAVKKNNNTAGESWAIFEQPNLHTSQTVMKDTNIVQSEEGVSPWSSDSKEFGGNGSSPPEWRQRLDSGSGGGVTQHRGTSGRSGGIGHHHQPQQQQQQQQQPRQHGGRRDMVESGSGWWDNTPEPEVQYYPANRRSTDSYDDECYDCYDRPPPRRSNRPPPRQPSSITTTGPPLATTDVNIPPGGGGVVIATGGAQSSSSRDVSPWEEEIPPRAATRRIGEGGRQTWSSRHTRPHSFDRHRRHTDSWDEEDDYEYEEEHSSRFHYPERLREVGSVDRERERERDRHSGSSGGRELEWNDEWAGEETRKHRRSKRESERDSRDRWCCPEWEQTPTDKLSRYTSSRWSNPERRKPHQPPPDERYYQPRDTGESPWDDEYSNGGETSSQQQHVHPHYVTTRRNWKRPSSASEMDRKTGEIKSRGGAGGGGGGGQYYLGTGGSDGERDRRHKTNRRSKSRDSTNYTDTQHPLPTGSRHKSDLNPNTPFPTPSPSSLLSGASTITAASSSSTSGNTVVSMRRSKQHHHHQQYHYHDQSHFDGGNKPTNAKKMSSATVPRSKQTSAGKQQQLSKGVDKSNRTISSMFENDFVPSESDSPSLSAVASVVSSQALLQQRFTFENEFETSEAESPPPVGGVVVGGSGGGKLAASARSYYQTAPKSQSLSGGGGGRFEGEFARRQQRATKFRSVGGSMDAGVKVKSHTSTRPPTSTPKQQKSLFEDDFSPPTILTTDHTSPDDQPPIITTTNNTTTTTTIIEEERSLDQDDDDDEEDDDNDDYELNNDDFGEDLFTATNDLNRPQAQPVATQQPVNIRRSNKRLSGGRLFSQGSGGHANIKKSTSVNIFAPREEDPFDDDFFSTQQEAEVREEGVGRRRGRGDVDEEEEDDDEDEEEDDDEEEEDRGRKRIPEKYRDYLAKKY